MIIDLHLHSRFSDGEYAPDELMAFIKGNGVQAGALCDHDTLSGLGEARAAAEKEGLAIISGVELTTIHQGREIHLLGYNFDPRNKLLRKEVQQLKNARLLRVKRILAKLREQGVMIHDRDVCLDEDNLNSSSETVLAYGRPHIAKVLCEKGYTSSYKEAFEKYIGNESPAYIAKESLTTSQGIQLLKKAGALTVIAHPENNVQEEAIDVLIESGLDGLEVYCPAHDDMQVYHYELMAGKKGLLMTGGTDLHSSKGYETKLTRLNRDTVFIENLIKAFPQLDPARTES